MLHEQFLRRKQAAEYLRSRFGHGSAATLAKLACIGGGPRYRKSGRFPVYVTTDLDDWAISRLGPPQRSTSDAPRQPATPNSVAARGG